jgi:hypothetical protein
MDEVIYCASGPLSYVVSMDEVVYSAPWRDVWRPWQKSAIVWAVLLQRDWNTSPSQIRTPIHFAALLLLLLLFNPLTDFSGSFATLHVPAASRWNKTVQTNGSIARNASEEDKESAAAQAAAAAAAAAAAEAAEAAVAACWCKLEQTSLQSWLKRFHWVWIDTVTDHISGPGK